MTTNNEFWSKYYKIRYGSRIPRSRTKAEISFLMKNTTIKNAKSILDFSCGYGRHALELAKLGLNIDGFDLDRESIEIAQKKAAMYSLKNIHLWVDNSLTFITDKKYDMTICMYTSIGFMDHDENIKIIGNLSNSVKPSGFIVLDLMNRNWAINNCIPEMKKHVIYQNIGYDISHNRRIEKKKWYHEVNSISFTNTLTGEKAETNYKLELFSFNEIVNILNINGMRIESAFGGYGGEALSDHLQRFIIVAKRIS